MVTKTLTITEDAYNLLALHKQRSESFSEEIKRIFSKKKYKQLSDFFGILAKKEGDEMLKDLEKIKSMELQSLKKRLQ